MTSIAAELLQYIFTSYIIAMESSGFPATQDGVSNASSLYSNLVHQAFPAGLPASHIPSLKPSTPWLTETMSTGSLTKLSDEVILEIIKYLYLRDPLFAPQDNHPARNVLNLGL